VYNGLSKFLGRLLYAYLHPLLGALLNSVGSHGSLSLSFVMKMMVCHFARDSHEVMTALILMLPIIVVVEISLQLHQAFSELLGDGKSCV
jgi:hypothetical protein